MSRATESDRSLAALMDFDPNEVDINDRKEWQAMKADLGREFLRLANDDAIPWSRIDAFLYRLPAIQEEAEKHVTGSRLQFLYGDLGATISKACEFSMQQSGMFKKGLSCTRLNVTGCITKN